MSVMEIKRGVPCVASTATIADDAYVVGEVDLADNVGVGARTVIRGDINRIAVGENTVIGANCTLHVTDHNPCLVGSGAIVDTDVILHGCTIENDCVIEKNAIVLNGAIVGEGCIIKADTIITEGKIFPPNSVIEGIPGRAQAGK